MNVENKVFVPSVEVRYLGECGAGAVGGEVAGGGVVCARKENALTRGACFADCRYCSLDGVGPCIDVEVMLKGFLATRWEQIITR